MTSEKSGGRPWEIEERASDVETAQSASQILSVSSPAVSYASSDPGYGTQVSGQLGSRRASGSVPSPSPRQRFPVNLGLEERTSGVLAAQPAEPPLFSRQRLENIREQGITLGPSEKVRVEPAVPDQSLRERPPFVEVEREGTQAMPTGEGSPKIRESAPTRGGPSDLAGQELSCRTCYSLRVPVQQIVDDLGILHSALSRLFTLDTPGQLSSSDLGKRPPDIISYGLEPSVAWACDIIKSANRMIRELSVLKSRPVSSESPTKSRVDYQTRTAPTGGKRRRKGEHLILSSKQELPGAASFETGDSESHLVGIQQNDFQSRHTGATLGGPPSESAAFLSRTSSSFNSGLVPAQSLPPPIAAPPSPSSAVFPPIKGFPPISPSLLQYRSPLASQYPLHPAHTDVTARLDNLQREHEKLLMAFARLQARCVSLESGLHVSESEANKLTEERNKLHRLLRASEAQIEELQKSRDDAHKQSAANGAQYSRIVAMSSKLHAQGADDLKKWRHEKEEWEKEREDFRLKVAVLERIKSLLVSDSDSFLPGPPSPKTVLGVEPPSHDEI